MNTPIGHTRWAIAEGSVPAWSNGREPAFTSHEPACLLNTGARMPTSRSPSPTAGDDCQRFLLQRLSEWDITRIYGYPGDGINGLIGALDRDSDRIEFIQEQWCTRRHPVSNQLLVHQASLRQRM